MNMMTRKWLPLCVLSMLVAVWSQAAEPWRRHTVDDTSRGADGVRLADVNGDGHQDITTAWEEGGVIRVYLNPGPKKTKQPWPQVTVGKVKSPEDAVFVDLDGDGAVDVVSSCEGGNRTMYVHWAPKDKARYLDAQAWTTEPIPATSKKQSWMYAVPMDIDGENGLDLVVSSKGRGSSVGWLQSPSDPRKMADWKYHKLYSAGWIMSLERDDIDGDGDDDIVVSDRRGRNSGMLWLENPGAKAAASGSAWKENRFGPKGGEVMFLDVADIDKDGRKDVLAALKGNTVQIYFRPKDHVRDHWPTHRFKVSGGGIGNAKAVRVGDIDGDGRQDIVYTCEGATGTREGVFWLSYAKSPRESQWQRHSISGPKGSKFDHLKLLDLDADGDLDVLTCEERANLGVFWYENPTK